MRSSSSSSSSGDGLPVLHAAHVAWCCASVTGAAHCGGSLLPCPTRPVTCTRPALPGRPPWAPPPTQLPQGRRPAWPAAHPRPQPRACASAHVFHAAHGGLRRRAGCRAGLPRRACCYATRTRQLAAEGGTPYTRTHTNTPVFHGAEAGHWRGVCDLGQGRHGQRGRALQQRHAERACDFGMLAHNQRQPRSLTVVHTHTHTHACARTHTHTHTRVRAHARTTCLSGLCCCRRSASAAADGSLLARSAPSSAARRDSSESYTASLTCSACAQVCVGRPVLLVLLHTSNTHSSAQKVRAAPDASTTITQACTHAGRARRAPGACQHSRPGSMC
jgi:hypothetical protein